MAEPKLEVLESAAAAAERAADVIAAELGATVDARGRAVLALSGGRTPVPMFAALAQAPIRWDKLDVFQVDERVAPEGDENRNAEHIRAALAAPVKLHPERFHWMKVTEQKLDNAARQYELALRTAAGVPPIVDVIHLGLGADGHVASIFPGSALDEGRDVGVTEFRQGRRRMSVTTPLINRARMIVWLVTGRDKAPVLGRVLRGEPGLVASRIRRTGVVIVADADAAGDVRAGATR